MVETQKTEITILAGAKELQKTINNDFKARSHQEQRIHEETEKTQSLHFKLLEKNYLDLQNEFDTLQKKYLDLELKYHNLESDKSLTNHEKSRMIEKYGKDLMQYKSENHTMSIENYQLYFY